MGLRRRETLTQARGVTLVPPTRCLIASLCICNALTLQSLLGPRETGKQIAGECWWRRRGGGVDKRDVCSVGGGVKVNLIGHVYSGRGAAQEHLHPVAWPHLLQFWVSFPFAREITARIWKQWMEEVNAISFTGRGEEGGGSGRGGGRARRGERSPSAGISLAGAGRNRNQGGSGISLRAGSLIPSPVSNSPTPPSDRTRLTPGAEVRAGADVVSAAPWRSGNLMWRL